jgi:hypothetical protein
MGISRSRHEIAATAHVNVPEIRIVTISTRSVITAR